MEQDVDKYTGELYISFDDVRETNKLLDDIGVPFSGKTLYERISSVSFILRRELVPNDRKRED